MIKRLAKATFALLALASSIAIAEDLTCSDAEIFGTNITKNICWSCIFPIRVAGVMLGDGVAPQSAADGAVCTCVDTNGVPRFGMITGKWNTSKLIEMTPVAFCSSVMGGTKLQDSWRKFGGQPHTPQGEGQEPTVAYYNYHTFAFDLMAMLELFSKIKCQNNDTIIEDFDLAFMSEYDPTWSDENLAMFAFPETGLFSNPIAQLAQIPDCFAASIGKPIDSFFWTVGCWGHIYPITGHITSTRHPAMEINLLSARALALEHRRYFAHRTVGSDVLCESEYFPHLPKSQYKFQLMFPSPEAESIAGAIKNTVTRDPDADEPDSGGSQDDVNHNTPTPEEADEIEAENPGDGDESGWGKQDKCCHWLGETTFRWGEHRERPNKDDWVVLIWNWQDCCMVY